MALRIDHAAARRFRRFDMFIRLQLPIGAFVLSAMVWAIVAHAYGWAWGVFAVSFTMSPLGWVLRPRAYPVIDAAGASIRLRHLDQDAAHEWLAGNDAASMTVIPEDGPRRRRRFLFGTKPMFLALMAYVLLCMLTVHYVFEADIVVPRWLVVLPIILTIALAWVPVEIIAMILFWRSIPLQRRPHSFTLLPEFQHVHELYVLVCLVGLLAATGMNALVWIMWARAV